MVLLASPAIMSSRRSVVTTTCTCGHRSWNAISSSGSSAVDTDSTLPNLIVPRTSCDGASPSSTAVRARDTASATSFAWNAKVLPCSVSRTPRGMRSNRRTPSSCSSWRICTVTADCE